MHNCAHTQYTNYTFFVFHGENRSEVAMHHLGIKVADCSLFIGIQGLYFGGYETAKGFLGGGANGDGHMTENEDTIGKTDTDASSACNMAPFLNLLTLCFGVTLVSHVQAMFMSFHSGVFCFVSENLLFVQFFTPMFQSFGSPCCFAVFGCWLQRRPFQSSERSRMFEE